MNNNFKCKWCDKTFDVYNSLSRHAIIMHKKTVGEVFVEVNLEGVWPKCNCGCGENMLWSAKLKQFRRFKAGHQSRIHNNWGHNQKAIENSSNTRRKQFESGERTVWNIGLNKETDDRVKMNGEKSGNSIRNNKTELNRRSESMSKLRKNGTIPTLYREKSSRWKGGVSSIQQLARSDKRLYDSWKHPILVRDGFKCKVCPNTKDLHVHHNGESFSEIIKKVMTIDDYEKIDDFETKRSVTDRVIEYHVTHNVEGETLCKECHNKLHPSLNF